MRLFNTKHCGACYRRFETAKELAEHLKDCVLSNTQKDLMEGRNIEGKKIKRNFALMGIKSYSLTRRK